MFIPIDVYVEEGSHTVVKAMQSYDGVSVRFQKGRFRGMGA